MAHEPSSCVQRYTPTLRSFGGCLPCPQLPYVDPAVAANRTQREHFDFTLRFAALYSECIHCMLISGEPFLVGRPGMGAPEEVACRVMTGRTHRADNMTHFMLDQRQTLKTLNGILTKSEEDAVQYARCYAASINASDVIVRIGGGAVMPLRKPSHTCAQPGTKHHQKSDILITQWGSFPWRVIGDHGLNPWMLPAYYGASHLRLNLDDPTSQQLLPRIFSWTRALVGRTVLVVHPFNESIVSQLRRGSRALWGRYAEHVMPAGIRFKVVAPPQNLAKARASHDWRHALGQLISHVDAAGPFDLAMISCGGLGMLLGAHLRATNRSSMYHGGELQLWFGVYGRRWIELQSKKILNQTLLANWVRPSAAETPAGAGAVEKGTYW